MEGNERRHAVARRAEELLAPGSGRARAARSARVVWIVLRTLVAIAVLDAVPALFGRRTLAERAARRVRLACHRLGPSFVKVGQFVASGEGLFPPVLVAEFGDTRDRCPPAPWSKVRRVLESELGDIDAVFASIDHEPLASASIAQVHCATLKDGRDVVVKVQRPEVRGQVEAHLRTMPGIARLVARLFPDAVMVDPQEVVRLVAGTVLAELDFHLEAENLRDIAGDLAKGGITDIVVPEVVDGLVGERVLVMDRLDGLRADDAVGLAAAGIDAAAFVTAGFRSVVEGATVFGRFHGDLHAGNIIALPDGRFGLVDFGICARLSKGERTGLQRLLIGIATGDQLAQVHGLDAMGALPDSLDRRLLAARLAVAAERRKAGALDDLREGRTTLLAMFAEQRLRLPIGLVLFLKDVIYLSGTARAVAPGIDLLAAFGSVSAHFDAKYGSDRAALAGATPYGGPLAEDELALAAEVPVAAPQTPPSAAALARRIGPELVRSVLGPIAAFVGGAALGGLALAIVFAAVFALGVNVAGRRRGRKSPLAYVTLSFIVVRGAAGLLTGSGTVYFAPEIGMNFVYAGLLGATVLAGRPFVGVVAQRLHRFPPAAKRHPLVRKVFRRLTLLWATYLVVSGALQVWLVLNVSPATFVVVKRSVTLPCLVALAVLSIRYPVRRFRRDEGLRTLLA